MNVLVQALAAQQLHDLPLLMRQHASEGHAVVHHGLYQCSIGLLQQKLKGWPSHTALHIALQPPQ